MSLVKSSVVQPKNNSKLLKNNLLSFIWIRICSNPFFWFEHFSGTSPYWEPTEHFSHLFQEPFICIFYNFRKFPLKFEPRESNSGNFFFIKNFLHFDIIQSLKNRSILITFHVVVITRRRAINSPSASAVDGIQHISMSTRFMHNTHKSC